MATAAATTQSSSEVVTYTFDYTSDLPSGATVISASVTHTPPSGSATVPSVAVSSPNVSVQIGALSVAGLHRLNVLATFNNGDISEFVLTIDV